MATSAAATVAAYLASLPADRRKLVSRVRSFVRKHLPKGYREVMQYGMISWVVPPQRYPDTYNKQPLAIAGLASQKQYVSLYLYGVYADPAGRKRFERDYRAAGKRLDMGKSCVRFGAIDDLALDVLARVLGAVSVERYIELYETSRRR